VLNHPDIHQEALSHVLETIPSDGRRDCTANEAADWWRRTHVRGALEVDGRCVRSRDAVAGVGDEVREPDGTVRTLTVDLPGGACAQL
jgi:hypothetical protein